jgi:hypothetical protein
VIVVRSKLKGGKIRHIPLTAELAAEIQRYPAVIGKDRIFRRIYATGWGDVSGAIMNGEVATGAIPLADDTVRVDIDGQPSVVTYAGTTAGRSPDWFRSSPLFHRRCARGAAIPITVSVGSATAARRSQPLVTIAVK